MSIFEGFMHVSQNLKEGQQKNKIRRDIDANHLVIFIMVALRIFIKKWQFAWFSFNLVNEGSKLIESLKLFIQNDETEINEYSI